MFGPDVVWCGVVWCGVGELRHLLFPFLALLDLLLSTHTHTERVMSADIVEKKREKERERERKKEKSEILYKREPK